MSALRVVPSPTEVSAEGLILELRRRGARVLRMKVPPRTFCLTDDAETATWLHHLGASPYLPRSAEFTDGLPVGAYRRAKGGKVEWDFHINLIAVHGEETIWEAAGRLAKGSA